MKIKYRPVLINVEIIILIKNININSFVYQHLLKQEDIVFNILAGIVIAVVYHAVVPINIIVLLVALVPTY